MNKMETMTDRKVAELIIDTLRTHDVEPDETFEAAAGRDYGLVEAYLMSNAKYAVKYGDNGTTNYDIADNADDLAEWLEYPDLDAADTAIQTANVRGIGQVTAAPDDGDREVAVLITHFYFGPTEVTSLADDTTWEFPRQAEAWVAEQESGIYVTQHNESSRPTYTIVEV